MAGAGWDNIIAAIAGALSGGGQAYQQVQEQQRQKDEQEQAARDREWQRTMQQQDADARARDRQQKAVTDMLMSMGPNAPLTADQKASVDKAGLGYRYQDVPDVDMNHSMFENIPLPGVPIVPMPTGTTTTRVKPTYEEQTARDTAAQQKQNAFENQMKLSDLIRTLPPTAQTAVRVGQLTGKMPTLNPDEFVTPEQKLANEVTKAQTLGPIETQQAVDRAKGTEQATLPFKLQLHEGERKIDQKYDTPAFQPGTDGAPNPTAQAIANYQIPPPSPRSLATPNGMALMAEVMKMNPSYSAAEFPVRQKTRTAFTSGQQAQTLNSLNTAIEHLDQFLGVADAMGNGSFQPGNAAYNWLRTVTGDSAATNFDGMKTIMSGELASAFKKSGATDQEIKSVQQAISSKASPQQLSDYVTRVAIPALGSKAATFDEQYHGVMGDKDPWSAISPRAKKVLQKYGLDASNPTVGGSTPAASNSSKKGPPVGTERMINGRRARWDGQGWVAQ